MDRTRQYGSLEQIRADHVKRYRFAASRIQKGASVLDIACGCGYGSRILHDARLKTTGIDISSEAIEYAIHNYNGPSYLQAKAEDLGDLSFDAVVSFETLEHLKEPEKLLAKIKTELLIASVPNEEKYPFWAERFAGDEYPHQRHYTPPQLHELLENAGYSILEWFTQKDRKGDIVPGMDGIFLIAICRPSFL